MKKGIRLVLSILIIVAICSGVMISASAVEASSSYLDAKSYLVTDSVAGNTTQPYFAGGKVTFKINLASNLTVTGALVSVKYNKNVLKVVDAGPVTTSDASGNQTEVVTGMHTHGVPKDNDSAYTFAYISANGYKTGGSGKEFAYITFQVIDPTYPLTTIEFVSGDHTSSSVIKTYTNISTLDAGTISSVTAGNKAITLKWNTVPTATEYVVYRKGGADSSYRQLAVVKTTTYTDSDKIVNGTKYTYAIRAKNTSGYGGYIGKVVTYLDTVNITVVNDTKGVKIAWNKVEGATGYIVYKRAKGTSSWTEVASVDGNTLSVNDSAITSGVVYEYTACAVKGDSSSGLAEIKTIQYVGVVSKVTLANANGGVSIKWNAVSGAEKYRIYRKLSGESNWTTLVDVNSDVLSFVDKSAVTGAANYYAVRALSNNTWSSYESFGINYIAAPQATKVTSVINSGITLNWNQVAGAAKYRVYRASDDGKKWILLDKVTGTSYTDKNVTLGKKYRYTLRAENGKNLSGYNTKGWTVQYTLTTPVASSISVSGNSIVIKWGAVTGAEGYRVYRKANAETKWTQIATVSGTSYTDKNLSAGVKYTYTLRAYSGKTLSAYNKTGWVGVVLGTPTVKIANAAKGVKVAWSQVAGAEGYTVYRSQLDTTTGKWSKWKNRGTAKATKSSWVDTKTTSGVTYKFTVRAVAGNTKSAYKASNTVLYLAQPTVKIANADTGVKVSWTKAAGATGYRVYRSQLDTATGTWSKWKTMGTAKATKSSWIDKSVVDGVTYKYTARTVSGKVLSSYTQTGSLVFLKVPTLVSCVKGAEGVVLTFEQNPKADSYRIYRKTANESWVLINTVSGTQNTTYTDKTVVAGTQYIYTVRSVSGKSVSYYNKTGLSVNA